MRMLLFLLWLLLWSPCARAQQQGQPVYNPVKLFDMAGTADLVTYGTISRLEESYYYLDCVNEHNRKMTILVKRYVTRNGSFRGLPYETGQRVFVFLKKNGVSYSLLSPGAEAELLITKDSLVVDMRCFSNKTMNSLAPRGVITPAYREAQTFPVGARKVFGLRFTPRYLYEAIMAFRDCYQVIRKKPDTYPSFTCFNFFDRQMREKTEARKRKSRLMKLMYTDMEETQQLNCK